MSPERLDSRGRKGLVRPIATHARSGALHWAIAGRNRNPLEAVKAETGADVADYSVPLFWKRRCAVADDQRFKREADRLGAKCTLLKSRRRADCVTQRW